ncbi:MAG: hypothetical protein AB2A00_25480 [Myxococcota bacterium]
MIAGIGGALLGLSTAAGLQAKQRHMTQALSIADYVMEDLVSRTQGDSQLTSAGCTGTNCTVYFDGAGRKVAAGGTYTAEWSVAGYAPVPGLKQITLAISWNHQGATRSITLQTVRN